MKKVLQVILILTSIYFISCSNSSKKTDNESKITLKKDDFELFKISDQFFKDTNLIQKTPEYLRYARNSIFAQHGYVFKDSCLNSFFNFQDWYKPTDSNIELNAGEKELLEKIKKLESNDSIKAPYQIISSYSFNDHPLYYIASGVFYDKYADKEEYRDANFYLLPVQFQWILNCSNIPPEYIIEKSIGQVRCVDVVYPVKKEEIELINFDKGCTNGEDQELMIRLYGPSNDDEHNIIGFDEDGKFDMLLKDVFITNYEKKDKTTVTFLSKERCDRIGTRFCEIEFEYNSVTKQVNRITEEEFEYSIYAKLKSDSIITYTSPRAAKKRNKDSIAFVIYQNPNEEIKISHFLGKQYKFVYKVNDTAWINLETLHDFGVLWAD